MFWFPINSLDPINHGGSPSSILLRHFSMLIFELSLPIISILGIKYSPSCSPAHESTCIRHTCIYVHIHTLEPIHMFAHLKID
jgi:hypothetical protein